MKRSIISFLLALALSIAGVVSNSWPESSLAPTIVGQQQGPDRIKLSRDIIQLEEVVSRNPTNYQAWVQIGNDYFDLGDAQKSVNAYTKALEIKDGDPNVLTDLGVMYRQLNDFTRAVSAFRRAAMISPTHPQCRMNLGVVLMHDLNDPKSAIAAWEDYLRVAPNDPNADAIRRSIGELRGQVGDGTQTPAVTQAAASSLPITNGIATLQPLSQKAENGDAPAQFALGVIYETGDGVPEDKVEATKWYRMAAERGHIEAQYSLGLICKGLLNFVEAVKWFRKAAEQGNALAQNDLAVMFAKGEGVPKNAAEAVKWYRNAAEQGLAPAQTNLGIMYNNGEGVPENKPNAAKWYRMAAEQGHARAQYNLGVMNDNGEGIPKNKTEALKWYHLAAEQGYISAQFNLGVKYAQGEDVPKDDMKAAIWFRKAAEQGDTEAQFQLGSMYLRGEGVPKDDAEAAKWYRMAAEQGDADAQRDLGRLYDNGDGVAENDSEAIKWYRMAAEQGDAKAQFNLGVMYANGEGVQVDAAEAIKWYRKAAEQGLSEAQTNLRSMYEDEVGKWYRSAAEQGDADAQFNLGLMYADGRGVPTDAAEAVKWYRRSAEQGYPSAQVNLGRAYHLGVGVPEDFIEAYKWFILAAAQNSEVAGLARQKKALVAESMTSAMIAIAQERASNWRAKPEKSTAGLDTVPKHDEPVSSGSGFFINSRGDLISNFHVVNGCSSLKVWFDGKPYAARLVKFDERNDLALLSAKTSTTTKRIVLRSAGNVGLGELVLVAGYPLRGLLADSLNVSSGNVSSLAGPKNDSRLLQITAPVQPGNSGGPVFDQNGLVIGVVVAKLDAVLIAGVTGDIPQNVNFAIKGAVIRSFLEVNDTEFSTEVPGQTMKVEEIAAKARLSTVAVECMR